MKNPASEYCIQQGGTLDIVKDKDGNQIGMCRLPDGRVVEEWAFFRSQHAQDQDELSSDQREKPGASGTDAKAVKQTIDRV